MKNTAFAQKATRAERLRRTVGGTMSGTLAYTSLCIVMLTFAVCLDKMPEEVLAKVHALFG